MPWPFSRPRKPHRHATQKGYPSLPGRGYTVYPESHRGYPEGYPVYPEIERPLDSTDAGESGEWRRTGERGTVFPARRAGGEGPSDSVWSAPRRPRDQHVDEWKPRLCRKPKVKCGVCPNQAFPPLTDEVIEGHLRGRHTVGVYPIRQDDTCRFLAADFDRKTWQRDAEAFLGACRSKRIPAALERSRSSTATSSPTATNGAFSGRFGAFRPQRSQRSPTKRVDGAASSVYACRLRNATRSLGGHGNEGGRALMQRLEEIREAEERVLVATGRYIGEGFDDARLDTLFLTMPFSWRGTFAQYVGRLRSADTPSTTAGSSTSSASRTIRLTCSRPSISCE